jgi:hypothetical protein
LGTSVSAAGDLNGDGYADFVAGAPDYSNDQGSEGAAYVYYGGAAGIGTTPTILEGNYTDARFGVSVSAAGDVNGDGYADLVIGAYGYTSTGSESNEGAAYVCYGSAAGIGLTRTLLQSNQADAELGQSVSGAGDLNGDGYDDIAVGAPYYDNGQTDEGAAFVYWGRSTGIMATPTRLEANQAGAHFGNSVSAAGDLNGDGYPDIVVGAENFSDGEALEGAAFVYYGGAAGLGTTPTRLEANQAGAWFGRSASGAGDVNGDGIADLMVGAPFYDIGGAAFLYHGSADSHSSLVVTDATVGTACDEYGNGGVRIRSGLDDGSPTGIPDDGVLQTGEVDSTAYVCNGATGGNDGHNSIIVTDATVGTACDAFGNGGSRIRSGVDDGTPAGTADDSVLQDGEVDSTAYVCNGATGAAGHASIIVTDATVGASCDAYGNGGTRTRSGMDDGTPAGTADDGTLQDGEVDSTAYVCNGAAGGTGHASIIVTDATVGTACDAQGNGGTRIRSGVDDGTPAGTADDGVLQDGEVDSTAYVCNGAAGAAGHDSVIVTDATVGTACDAQGNGGTRIRSGVDDGAGGGIADDGVLQDGEVDSTAYVCNGAAGGTGSVHGSIILVDAAVGIACDAYGNGGQRIRRGVDDGTPTGTADDGVLDAGEVDATAVVCNGASAVSLVAMVDEPAGSNCAHGGERIDSGADTDRDGTLDASEVSSSSYLCDAAPGAAGKSGSGCASAPGGMGGAWLAASALLLALRRRRLHRR